MENGTKLKDLLEAMQPALLMPNRAKGGLNHYLQSPAKASGLKKWMRSGSLNGWILPCVEELLRKIILPNRICTD